MRRILTISACACTALAALSGCPHDKTQPPTGDDRVLTPPFVGDSELAGGDVASDAGSDALASDAGSDTAAWLVIPDPGAVPVVAAAKWIPRHAPQWARVASGSVLVADHGQLLSASDCVRGIRNISLARTAAANRARARLARIVMQLESGEPPPDRVAAFARGVTIAEYWQHPRGPVVCARAVIPVTVK